jgi:hypothetical protein
VWHPKAIGQAAHPVSDIESAPVTAAGLLTLNRWNPLLSRGRLNLYTRRFPLFLRIRACRCTANFWDQLPPTIIVVILLLLAPPQFHLTPQDDVRGAVLLGAIGGLCLHQPDTEESSFQRVRHHLVQSIEPATTKCTSRLLDMEHLAAGPLDAAVLHRDQLDGAGSPVVTGARPPAGGILPVGRILAHAVVDGLGA